MSNFYAYPFRDVGTAGVLGHVPPFDFEIVPTSLLTFHLAKIDLGAHGSAAWEREVLNKRV